MTFLVSHFDQDSKEEQDRIPPSTTIKRLIELIEIVESKGVKAFVITTNYDRHFERAYFDRFHCQPCVAVYRGGSDPADRAAKLNYSPTGEPLAAYWEPADRNLTILYKMHACISYAKERGVVITEEDYINFLTNALNGGLEKQIPFHVMGQLETSTIVFIGYSLADWNFRTIFKATVERRLNKDIRSYAVQYHPRVSPGEVDRLPIITRFIPRTGLCHKHILTYANLIHCRFGIGQGRGFVHSHEALIQRGFNVAVIEHVLKN